MLQPTTPAVVPTIVPGQDFLIAQLGVAGVFLLIVIAAVLALWKKSNADRDAAAKERRDSEANAQAERQRLYAEMFAQHEKSRAEFLKAIEDSRTEFLAEIRRKDDALQSQSQRFETKVEQITRDNNIAVQAMHAKADETYRSFAALTDSLARRLTATG